MSKCIACRQGFIWECEFNGRCDESTSDAADNNVSGVTDDSDSSSKNVSEAIDLLGEDDQDFDFDSGELEEDSGNKGRQVNIHNDHNLKDQQSTGRKRAAVMYPLDRDADCEWKMKKNCGGGPKPIFGCLNGKQQARHHGPDKNTLNNDKGNVHRICVTCHNRWHTDNDPVYVFGILQNEHSPVEATLAEMGANEMQWAGRKLVKANDDK